MTIAKMLEFAGVSLDQNIGFIFESLDDSGIWRVEYANVAIVCEEMPKGAQYYEQAQKFNPECSLAVQWEENGATFICIISKTDDSKFIFVEPSGALIDSPETRVWLGQSPVFMENVKDVMKILKHTEPVMH